MTDEGELLRNQLARLIEEERFGWVGNPETLTPGMTIATSESLADKILARFDVRLREPQAEETP